MKANKDYVLEVIDMASAMHTINLAADQAKCHVSEFTIENLAEGFRVSFHTEFGSGGRKKRQQQFLATLTKDTTIRSVKTAEDVVGV